MEESRDMGAWTLRAVVLAWAVAVTLSQSSIVSGAELSLARRFARGDLALLVVRLTQGNASAVELASAKFCVQTDFLAQLTLPGSWSGFFSLPGVQGNCFGRRMREERYSLCWLQ